MEAVLSLPRKNRNFTSGFVIKTALIVLLAVAVVLPLFFMLAELGGSKTGEILRSGAFYRAIGNSVLAGLSATAITMIFAFALAYAISRSNIRFKNVLRVVLTVPMLIPSIAHGMGLIVLFGNGGIFTHLFGTASRIYGFTGIMLGSVMYAFPAAFLMFNDILAYEDRSPYRAAEIMGITPLRQLKDITLPYLAKPLISIFFAMFTLIVTDYGVPLMVGGKFMTLPLFMYQEVIGQLNFSAGALTSIVLLIPAIAACVADMCQRSGPSENAVRADVFNRADRRRDAAVYVFMGLCVVAVLFPIVSFTVIGFMQNFPADTALTWANVATAFDMGAGGFVLNSLVIALAVGVLGTAVSYFTAYLTARSKGKITNRVLHLLSIASLAIPGVVLGISYSLMTKSSFLAGTLTILAFVNIVHFFSSPYLMAYNAFQKINRNYEVVTQIMGIGKLRFFADILMPETADTLLEMFSYYFVNSMVTISAVAFLANAFTNPLALMINQFETQMLIGCAAIVSALILAINLILKLTIYILKRRRMIRGYREEEIC